MITPDELLPVTAEGPRITIKASCFDCPFVVSESYRVPSDSGSNVYCAHPSFEKRRRVGDTVWDTPDFCPVADVPAIRARVQSHSLPGDALAGLEWSEDGYSLRTPYDGDVDGDGRHIVVGGETVVTFADSEAGDEYRARFLAALTPSPCPGDVGTGLIRDLLPYAEAATSSCASNDDYMILCDLIDKARAALTPSALSGDAGEDGDEFNRGVLIAVSTLINCWGAGTETEHLLAMINADAAMIERMGFDDYDSEPLLAALHSHQGAE